MLAEDFNTIVSKLQERVNGCRFYLDIIKDKESLSHLSVEEVLKIKLFCDKELVKQTRILMVDVYHIIGMGNLSVSQLCTFNKLIKEYSSYRPDIKAISKWDTKLSSLPNVPKKTSFKLLELGITVNSGRDNVDEVYEEKEDVDDYSEDTVETVEIPKENVVGKFNNGKIYLTSEQISDFIEDIKLKIVGFNNISKMDKIKKEITNESNSLGCKWKLENGLYVGKPNPSNLKLFKNYYLKED